MADPQDLSDLLRDWPHEPGKINARRFTGPDGKDKIQVRVDLGVLQMECDGRPDGTSPVDGPTVLEWQQGRRDDYVEQSGQPDGFVLSADECRQLREEAVQFYHRYVALYALGDYARVVRDASHNLSIFDLCNEHGSDGTDRTVLEQFRPQVVMMRGRAEAELAIAGGQPRDAVGALDRAIDEIEQIYINAEAMDQFDNANEVILLRGMRDALVPKLPASQRVELEERLRAAIDAENYELAAILRDELRMMK